MNVFTKKGKGGWSTGKQACRNNLMVLVLLLSLVSPQCLHTASQTRTLQIQLQDTSGSQKSSSQNTESRARAQVLRNVVSDDVVQGDVGVKRDDNTQNQINREGSMSGKNQCKGAKRSQGDARLVEESVQGEGLIRAGFTNFGGSLSLWRNEQFRLNAYCRLHKMEYSSYQSETFWQEGVFAQQCFGEDEQTFLYLFTYHEKKVRTCTSMSTHKKTFLPWGRDLQQRSINCEEEQVDARERIHTKEGRHYSWHVDDRRDALSRTHTPHQTNLAASAFSSSAVCPLPCVAMVWDELGVWTPRFPKRA